MFAPKPLLPPLAAAILNIGGCARPNYHEVRAACGLHPGEHVVIEYADEKTWEPIPTPCATALGEAIGLDWESFGEAGPRPIVAADLDWPIGSMVAGLAQLVAADFGPASRLHQSDVPPTAYAALRRAQLLRGAEADLGELLFTAIQAATRVVRLNADNDALFGEGDAAHTLDHHIVIRREWFGNAGAAVGAAILIHESLHREDAHDFDCNDLEANKDDGLYFPDTPGRQFSCDWDSQKVNGSTAWLLDILHGWVAAQSPEELDPDLSYAATEAIYFEISSECNLICDLSNFEPCAHTLAHNASRGELCTLDEGYFGGADP